MSETVDSTLLGGTVQEIARAMRLLRLQVESSSTRMGVVDQRLTNLEQGLDRLTSRVSRGFGQIQQQLTRTEKRFDAVDAGLGALREQAATNTRQLEEIAQLLRAQTKG